jgi:hypothetical protein
MEFSLYLSFYLRHSLKGCWGCGAELTEESPTEFHLAHRTFANNLAICILDHFAGRDDPNGRRGSHLAGGPVGCDRAFGPPELLQDVASSAADTCRVRVGPTQKAL